MTAITVGKRYKSCRGMTYFKVNFIGENKSFVEFDEGIEGTVKNHLFHDGTFIEVPETRKVTVYLYSSGEVSPTNFSNCAIASRVVEFEIGKFENIEE